MGSRELLHIILAMIRAFTRADPEDAPSLVLTQRGVVKEVLPPGTMDAAARAALRLVDHHGSSVTIFAASGRPPPVGARVPDPPSIGWVEIGIGEPG